MKNFILPAANVLFVKNNKALLGRRKNTGWMDGYLAPFGGHIDKGETPSAAIIREVQEELAVKIGPGDLEFICVAARKSSPNEYVSYEFVVRNGDYDFKNNETDRCSELVWVDLDKLPSDIVEGYRIVIEESLLDSKKFLEIGYNKQKH